MGQILQIIFDPFSYLTPVEIWDKKGYFGIGTGLYPGEEVFMPELESVIKAEIKRLAKREVRSFSLPLKQEVHRLSLKLSGLAKDISFLNRFAKEMGWEEAKPKLQAMPEEVKASRLTPKRITGLRKKLGISQRELGALVGMTIGAVASWESGRFKPKGEKKAALVALRKLKKRNVKKMLREMAEKNGKPEKKNRKKR